MVVCLNMGHYLSQFSTNCASLISKILIIIVKLLYKDVYEFLKQIKSFGGIPESK
jgi:hypothetical protein